VGVKSQTINVLLKSSSVYSIFDCKRRQALYGLCIREVLFVAAAESDCPDKKRNFQDVSPSVIRLREVCKNRRHICVIN
jgi:hypothetical protein